MRRFKFWLSMTGALALCGCTMSRQIDNGPVGPERNELRLVWPWSVCSEAPKAVEVVK